MGEGCVFENDDFADFNWETNDVSYERDTNTTFHSWTDLFLFDFFLNLENREIRNIYFSIVVFLCSGIKDYCVGSCFK